MHTTVLLHSSIDGLELKPGETFLDCTLGSGGHSEEVAKRFGKAVKIIAIDQDADAIARSTKKLEAVGADFTAVLGNFRNLDTILALALRSFSEAGGLGEVRVNKILFDLGWSTDQFEAGARGFSFKYDEPLKMTFKKVLPADCKGYCRSAGNKANRNDSGACGDHQKRNSRLLPSRQNPLRYENLPGSPHCSERRTPRTPGSIEESV